MVRALSLPVFQDRPLPEPAIGVLRKHRLSHLKELAVGRSIREARMRRACDSMTCTSVCCSTGVLADREEHARILAHTEAIQGVMDSDQEKDPTRWFDDEQIDDPDFPSRVAIGTSASGPRGCVFLNREGRCVLQKATLEGRVPVVLKPFYCTAFPITIDQGMLMLDVDNVAGTAHCCQPASDGERTALDAFRDELVHVLGAEGVEELGQVLANSQAPQR